MDRFTIAYQSIITPYESDGLADKTSVEQVEKIEPNGSLFHNYWTRVPQDAEIDFSNPEESAFDYEPEDPFLYAIEYGMTLDSSSSESKYEYEEPAPAKMRETARHAVKKFHKDFIYNEWLRDQKALAGAEIYDLELFLPQQIVTGTPRIAANFASYSENCMEDILF